jgi:hypothetical protein
VVLAGLITKSKTLVERGLPVLKDIPIAGRLFRFNSDVEARTELLIIMTPYILYEDSDADAIKQVETARMNWSLEQVVEMHGDIGVGPLMGMDGMVPTIYPDLDPALLESLPEEQQGPAETGQPNLSPPQDLPTPAAGGPTRPTSAPNQSSRRPDGEPTPAVSLAPADYQDARAGYWQRDPRNAARPFTPGVAPAGYQGGSQPNSAWPQPQSRPRPLPPTE